MLELYRNNKTNYYFSFEKLSFSEFLEHSNKNSCIIFTLKPLLTGLHQEGLNDVRVCLSTSVGSDEVYKMGHNHNNLL